MISFSLENYLYGLENISGIPGTVGGAVFQNAGAYGLEIKDLIKEVRGIDIKTNNQFSYSKEECAFIYRGSIFKNKRNLIITEVDLVLNTDFIPNSNYGGLKIIFDKYPNLTGNLLRDEIILLRQEKLPDWHKLGTAGSFFKNPIVIK